MTDAQAKAWSTIEKEAFAVVWALKKYKAWLFGLTSSARVLGPQSTAFSN